MGQNQKNLSDHPQLILPLVPETLKSFDLFFPGKNHLVLETLKADPPPQFIYLYGNKGSGKSHLLEAFTIEALKQQKRILFLPLRTLLKEKTYLKDWPEFDAVLIDDIEYLNPELQPDMCHQFNELQSRGTTLIVTSSAPPAALDFNLPDLKSRMESGLSLKIESLKEDELKTALMMHAKLMGLALDDKIYEFLLKRLERNLGTLTQQLKQIADYSLLTRRPVTTAMIKEVLGL